MTAIDLATLAFAGLMLIAAGVLAFLAGRRIGEAKALHQRAAERPLSPLEKDFAKHLSAAAARTARHLRQGGDHR